MIRHFSFLHPGVLYASVWSAALGFYALQYSELLVPLTPTALAFVLLSCLSFFFPSTALLLQTSRTTILCGAGSYTRTRGLSLYLAAWIGLSAIEVSIAGTLPILGLLGVGPYLRYTEFGVQSLHGLSNALLLVLSNYSIFRFITSRRGKYLFFYFLSLLWPLLLVTRQLFLSEVIQSLFIWVMYRRAISSNSTTSGPSSWSDQQRRWRVVRMGIGGGVALASVVLVFSLMGEIRNPGVQSISEWARLTPNYPTIVPEELIWFYLYLTSPLSNVVYNIDNLAPTYLPIMSLASMTPSVVRQSLLASFDYQHGNWDLVEEFMNVSSFHQPFLMDFGVGGALLVYAFGAVALYYIYFKSLYDERMSWQFAYGVVVHNIAMSPFANFFTHPVFLAQILLHLWLQRGRR